MTSLEGPAFSQGTNIAVTIIKGLITKYNTIGIHIQSCENELSALESVIYDREQYIAEHRDELIASATNKENRIESIRRAEDKIQEAKEYKEAEEKKLAKFKKQASTRGGKVAYALNPISEVKLKAGTDLARQVKDKHKESQDKRKDRHKEARELDEREKKRLGVVGDNKSLGDEKGLRGDKSSGDDKSRRDNKSRRMDRHMVRARDERKQKRMGVMGDDKSPGSN